MTALVLIRPYDEWLNSVLVKLGLIKAQPKKKANPPPVEEVKEPPEEVDIEYLKGLDCRHWKEQDHYAVLGLKRRRFKATENDIKLAYRRLVLRYHPDKRVDEDIDLETDFFECISKANEILADPIKRRSYDSVDPEFDDEVPSVNSYSRLNFFTVFSNAFEQNARWSTVTPVPKLGNTKSGREEVEEFYEFWYAFDSWREYSYEDEEDKERGQDREERRWIEKQNKVERLQKKKEEMTRIRKLVDNAYACDPRVSRFKEEEKKRKADQKKAKEDARKNKILEELRKRKDAEEAEAQRKLAEEEALKKVRDAEKKEKDAMKKQRRKEKKILEKLFTDQNYFAATDEEKLTNLQEFDRLCQFLSLPQLKELNSGMESLPDVSSMRDLFDQEVSRMRDLIQKEKDTHLIEAEEKKASKENTPGSAKKWSYEDRQLLIKAVNLFPAGTQSRWEVVAAYINQHSSSGTEKKAKETLSQAKELQKLDSTELKAEVNENAAKKALSGKVLTRVAMKEDDRPSERYDNENGTPDAWSSDEQALLEQALKSFPPSADRWQKIADSVPNRSKKECIIRYKELVERVKAKKSAQNAVSGKSARS